MLYSPDKNDDEGLRQTDGQALLQEPSPLCEPHTVLNKGARGARGMRISKGTSGGPPSEPLLLSLANPTYKYFLLWIQTAQTWLDGGEGLHRAEIHFTPLYLYIPVITKLA